MRIKKNSNEFKGFHRCTVLREHKNLNLTRDRNFWYDSAVVVKEIMKGYLKGKITPEDIPDMVSDRISNDGVCRESVRLQKELLTKSLIRAVISEKRRSCMVYPRVIPVGNYDVYVNPDAVFDDGETLEVVLYRAGKPNVTMKGQKEDASVGKCLELYFLHLYGRTLIRDGETRKIRASYYYMRKNTDKTNQPWDEDFFSGKGGNIVYLEQEFTGGSKSVTAMDERYLSQLSDFEKGRVCKNDECRCCSLKQACEYQNSPLPTERIGTGNKSKVIFTDAQQKIINFREGICRVNASAGSGKTECVTERGVRIIQEGTDSSKCLFITFTDTGAKEMKKRLSAKCLDRGLPVFEDSIHAMTFNGFAYRIVCREFKACGFSEPPTILGSVANAAIITNLLEEHRVEGLDYLHFSMDIPNLRGALSCCMRTFSIIKENNLDIGNAYGWMEIKRKLADCGYDRFIPDDAGKALCRLYEVYDNRLKEQNLILYADQELLMNRILDMYPGYLERFGYEHIVVDEFQDSNDTQLATISRLTDCKSFKSLMIVGDDSQAVFGFRNTSQENIIHFFEKIGKAGEDLYLMENRRSTPEILNLANKINDLNEEKVEKKMISVRSSGIKPVIRGFHSRKDEYDFIISETENMIKSGMDSNDIAIIAATRTELIQIGTEFSKKGIPWIMKNPMVLKDNPRIQSAIALAKAYLYPETDIHFFNYLVSKYDGNIFSEKEDEEIMEEIREIRSVICKGADDPEEKRNIFHTYLNDIKGTDEIYVHFLNQLFLRNSFEDEIDFIQDFDLFGEKEEKKLECFYDGVTLTTAHSSKGLEWKAVFITVTKFDSKALHSVLESKKDIEEKRRLLFVAMTRARDLLYVTGQYIAYGRLEDYTYNQFLRETSEAAGVLFDLEVPDNVKSRNKPKKAC